MEDLVSVFAIIAIIINLLVLIAFFQLVSNVTQIKHMVAKSGKHLESEFDKQMAYGNKEKALSVLEDIVWERYTHMVAGQKKGKYPGWLLKNLTQLRNEYEPRITELGGKYPNLI